MTQNKAPSSGSTHHQQHLTLGRVGAPHGIHGWLKITSHTTPGSNIFNYHPWQVLRGSAWQYIELTDKKMQGNTLLAKLPECDTPEQAKLWTNAIIAIDSDQLPQLKKDEYYWKDLIDCGVITQTGTALGKIKHIIETGSNDVFVVDGNKRHLIPYTNNVVMHIDTHNCIITVDWDPDF